MRVLYLMHVDWNWPRLRPHIFADGLSAAGHEVHVRYWFDYKMRGRRQGEVEELRALLNVPFRRYRPLGALTRALQKRQVARLLRRGYDLVYVTHPAMGAALPPSVECRVLYDCMDLATGFAATPHEADRIARMEANLLARADLVLCSSEALRRHIAAHGRDATLIRNALAVEKMPMLAELPPGPVDPVQVLYIGSVSPWFDFDTCLGLLEARPSVELTLIGPAEVAIPEHPRMRVLGYVPLQRVLAEAAACHALLMPFRLTPLTLAIDPIKLYEYISMRRPVLAVGYPELEHFGSLIRTYADVAELAALTDEIAAGRSAELMAPRSDAEAFVAVSGWDERMEQVLAAIPPAWTASAVAP